MSSYYDDISDYIRSLLDIFLTSDNEKTAVDYLYPFLRFSVHNFCARTDGQRFFEKALFFPPDQEYIYMSIPISIIFKISPPFWPKFVSLFSILEIVRNWLSEFIRPDTNGFGWFWILSWYDIRALAISSRIVVRFRSQWIWSLVT